MKNITLNTSKYRPHKSIIFKRSGYKKLRDRNWVRDVEDGRFHIVEEDKGINTLHFDLIIDGKHSVFNMPFTLSKEVKRIVKLNYCLLKPKEQEVIRWQKPKKRVKRDTRLRVY